MLNNKDELIDDILSGLNINKKTQMGKTEQLSEVEDILVQLGMAPKTAANTSVDKAPPASIKQPTIINETTPSVPQAVQPDGEIDFMRMLENKQISKNAHIASPKQDKAEQPIKTMFKQDPAVLNYFAVENPEAFGLDASDAVDLPQEYIDNTEDDAEDDIYKSAEIEKALDDLVFEDLSDDDLDVFRKQDEQYDQMYAKSQENLFAEKAETKEFDAVPPQADEQQVQPEKQNTLSNFNLNHGVEKEDFRKFFSTTISLDQEAEKHKPKRPAFTFAQKLMEKVQTHPEDEPIEISDLTDEDEEAIPDYNSHEDAQEILSDLKSSKIKLIFRLVGLSVICIVAMFIGLFGTLPFLPNIDVMADPVIYVLINFGLLFAAMVISIRTITNGVMSFFATPSADVLPTIAVFAAILQMVVLLFSGEGNTVLAFSTVAILGLIFNGIGKWMQLSVIIKNFELTTSRLDDSTAYVLENTELAKKVTEGLGDEEPRLMVSRQTGLVTGFLKNSFSTTDSDYKNAKLVPYIAVVAVVCTALTAIFTKNAALAATAFAGVFCVATPFTSTLVSALPQLLMRGAASKMGAVITGPTAVNQLSSVNTVMATARDIFPHGTVTLAGIKTFEKERIDLAILYAASLLVEGCETLRDIFISVIEGNLSMLYPVENLNKEIGYGFVGWIDHNRVIVGNRDMMRRHNIEVPSLDYEYRFTKGEKYPVYLAVSGKLFGMFLVKYHPDAEVGGVIEDLRNSGVGLMVNSDDFNVTSKMIEDIFMLKAGSVKVMSQKDCEMLAPSIAYLPKSEGAMSHIGTFASYLGGLYAATSAKAAEKSAWIVQTFGSAIGAIIMLVLTFTQGIASLSLTAVILFLLAWLILTISAPLLKKY